MAEKRSLEGFGEDAFIKRHYEIANRLGKIISSFPLCEEDERYNLATPIVMALGRDIAAMNKLKTSGLGYQSLPLMRVVIERLITFYYLMSCDSEEMENYEAYSTQKTYRKFQTEIEINGKKYGRIGNQISVDKENTNSSISLEDFPEEVQEAVKKFTGPKGRQKTRWSNKSLAQKLSVIDESGLLNISILMIALAETYDDASEMLHGTIYGCTIEFSTYIMQQRISEINQENINEIINKEYKRWMSSNYVLLNSLINQYAKFVSKRLNINDNITLLEAISKEIYG